MLDWLKDHETLFIWLTGASVLLFIATLIVVPIMFIRMRPNYFARKQHGRRPKGDKHPGVHLALKIGKNILGAVLIIAGLVMLALPGQGLLAILAGVLITDFPGRYRVARWIVTRRRVLAAINWLRKRAHREPLRITGMAAES